MRLAYVLCLVVGASALGGCTDKGPLKPRDTWTRMDVGVTDTLTAVWGTAADNVWAAGVDGVILHFDGDSWTPQSSGTTENLQAIWGLSANDVWAVGHRTALHWDGTSWTVTYTGSRHLSGVWGAASDNVWAVGRDGVMRWNGFTWVEDGPPRGQGIWGSATSNIWIADSERFHHFDGASWTTMPVQSSSSLFSVEEIHGQPGGQIWAVGVSKVARFDGVMWSAVSSPPEYTSLSCVWTLPDGSPWVADVVGQIYTQDNGNWVLSASSAGWAVWGLDRNTMFSVGTHGGIYRLIP